MKDILTAVETEQAKSVRQPESEVVLRDVQIRLDTDWQDTAFADGFPALYDSAGIAQCPFDLDSDEYNIYRFWSDPVGQKHYVHIVQGVYMHDYWEAGDGVGSNFWSWDYGQSGNWPSVPQRMGMTWLPWRTGVRMFYGNGGTLKAMDFEETSTVGDADFGTTYSVADDHVAFAPAGWRNCYQATLHEGADPFKYVKVKRISYDHVNETVSSATPSAATNVDAGADTPAWTNVNNTFASDDTYASVSMTPDMGTQCSDELQVTDFGFSIPTDHVITSLRVEVECKGSGNSITVNDLHFITSSGKHGTSTGGGPYWDTETTLTFDDPVGDGTWQGSFTPDMVNSSFFGVSLKLGAEIVNGVAEVDTITIRINHAAITTEICPHEIPVDEDYNVSSLQWFDAEAMTDKDVIVVNSRADGLPLIMTYEDGVWSNPKPIIPLDIVDDTNYIRIANLSFIPDIAGEDVMWATGRISRGGSTGAHAQDYDLALRSKDGVHWSIDRYSYLCSESKRSKIIVYGEYCYYPGGSTVMRGYRSWLMGGYHLIGNGHYDDIVRTVGPDWEGKSDLVSWTLNLTPAGNENSATTKLASQHGLYYPVTEDTDHLGRYLDADGDMAIFPGLWAWRKAGYNGETDIISVEAVDAVPSKYQAGAREFSFKSRDIIWRMLRDWASSQDWQWLSQIKHHDDCLGLVDELYSVSAGQITVENEEGEAAQVEQTDLEELEDNRQVFQTYNDPLIAFTTQPFDAKNFTVKARFMPENDGGGSMQGMGYDLSPAIGSPRLGHGFGVVGCGFDQYNVIAAWVDAITGKLYLIYRGADDWNASGYGTADNNKWYELASTALSDTSNLIHGELFEVKLTRDGRNLIATVFHFSSTGTPTRTEIARLEHNWSEAHKMARNGEEEYSGWSFDRGKVGVICNINVPETKVMHVRSGERHLARDLGRWPDETEGPWDSYDSEPDNHGETSGFSNKDTYAWFTEGGPPLHLGEEELELEKVTHSDWRSHYEYFSERITGREMKGQTESARETAGMDWATDGHGYKWLFVAMDGGGTGITEPINGWAIVDGVDRPNLTSCNEEDWDALTPAAGGNIGYTYFFMMPGFKVSNRGSGMSDKGDDYPRGTTVRQHNNDRIVLKGVWAYDDEHDKTLEWVLKDIASKAGVLDFDTAYSANHTVAAIHNAEDTVWIPTLENEDMYVKNFDLTFELPQLLDQWGSNDMLQVIFRVSSKSIDFSAVTEDDYALCLNYFNDGGTPKIQLYQLNNGGTTWVKADEAIMHDSMIGKTVRVVAHERFVTVYVNGCQAQTLACGPIYGYDTDGWGDELLEPGYVCMRTFDFDPSDTVITQPQLWALKDSTILDSRNSALSGMQRAIEDRRIKFVSTLRYVTDGGGNREAMPVLRFGYASLRYEPFELSGWEHWLGTFTDHRDTDPEFPTGGKHVSVFNDSVSETDRIPTHIRIIGAEICDYIDHEAAQRYGHNFVAYHCPSLEEEEAYKEAQRMVRDAVSKAGSRKPTTVAQLDWEPEDALELKYTPHDGGPSVYSNYIVQSVQFNFERASFLAKASLREFV